MPLITLTTDFGEKDPDLAFLKARIFQEVPGAQIIDITHQLTPFDTEEAVYILKNSLNFFPKKTIHIIAFNSEITPDNQALAIQTDNYFFLAHDNGIIPEILGKTPFKAFKLSVPIYERMLSYHIEAIKKFSTDAFPTLFSEEVKELKKINFPNPVIKYEGNKVKQIFPRVIYVDHYGNAVFNLKFDEFEQYRQNRSFKIYTDFDIFEKLNQAYHDITANEPGGIAGKAGIHFNNFGHLEIFVNGSNQYSGGANNLLGLTKNSQIKIIFD